MNLKLMKSVDFAEFEATLKNASDLLVTAEYEKKDGKKYHVCDVFHSASLGMYYRKDIIQKTTGGKQNVSTER